jgi:UDP-glucose:(heptosyl)LPS alpha-1,3-glucosyltransferase
VTPKIVLARQRIGDKFGGAEGYVAHLARAMRARGADVTLMAQEVDGELERDGFPLVRVASRWINVWGAYSFARAVRRYKRKHGACAVISFARIAGVDYIRAGDGCHRSYLEAMGKPGGASIKHRVMLFLERRAYTWPGLNLIFANSKMVANEIQLHYGVPPDRICVLYTGLPPAETDAVPDRGESRRRLELHPSSRTILFAGHNYERKGLETLLKAVAQTPDCGWSVLVAGKGKTEKYRALAVKLGIAASVKFLGARPLDELFAASDLFVLPTRYDPLARVCLEAARAGLPVITTARNGFSEWIDTGSGYVMSVPDDATELAGLLRRSHRNDLAAMGRRLQNRTAGLTIDGNAQELLKKIEEMGPGVA